MYKPISKKTLAAFAAPNFALAIMHMPVGYVIPALYAKYTSLSLATIGSILLFGRIFDAFSDPLIGYYSDRTQSRWGKRKPWMIIGTPIAMVAIIFLFSPPATAGYMYFLFWSVLLFASWTLIDIPYAAWGVELSRDYDERSRIMTWRSVVGYIGSILFLASPILLFPWTGNTEIGTEVMNIAAWMVALSLPILMYIAVKYVPTGINVSTQKVRLKDFIKSIKINKPLYRFMSALLIHGIGLGAWAATVLIFVDAYIGIGDKFIYLLLAAWIIRILVSPFWLKMFIKYGKHKVWATGAIISAVVTPTALLVSPGEAAFIPLLVYAIILGFFETAMYLAPFAIFGDIIDYDTLKTGSNKASSFYALKGLILKSISGVGGAIGFFLLSAFDFNVKGGNTPKQTVGIFVAFAAAPALFYLISGLIIKNFPLDARRQGIIKRRLESRSKHLKQGI
ncbi:MAG: MFS transporter [Bacteroidota bacterium]